MKTHFGILTCVIIACVASSSGLAQAGSSQPSVKNDDPRVAELAREVCKKGWIIYAARIPKELYLAKRLQNGNSKSNPAPEEAQSDWDLFIMRPDGTNIHNITNTPTFNEGLPRFSPDSKRILYRRIGADQNFDNNLHGMQGELVFADSNGSNTEVFGGPGEYTWASWGPEGKRIACMSAKGIYFVDLATKKEVGHLDRDGFFQQLTWSPDGKWLCGVANSFGTAWTVARIEIATGAANAVSSMNNCTPDWFPDSKQLIFSYRPANQENNIYGWTQLWMADAEGKKRSLVYGEDGRHVYGGDISPDGLYVLFTGNLEEDGDPDGSGAPMGLMRLSDAPTIGGESKSLRKLHGATKDGPVLVLPDGWEPHWTYHELGAEK
jgi:Tol biopolymer transport system component